jgi:hypothetical protein
VPETEVKPPPKLKVPENPAARRRRQHKEFNARIMKAVENQFKRNKLPRPPDKVKK